MADMNIFLDAQYSIGPMPKKKQIMSNEEEVHGRFGRRSAGNTLEGRAVYAFRFRE